MDEYEDRLMRSEEDTPVVERVLCVQSRADEGVIRTCGAVIPPAADNEVLLFLSYTYADVPLGRRYDCCFRRADETDVSWVTVTVVAATQQFLIGHDELPHGWKTLALLRFEPEIPTMIRDLPEASTWHQYPDTVFISDRDTWKARTT